MFGYIKAYKPELKLLEWEHYRGVYCALCKQLGRRFGPFARLTLSYDFAFLALFYMAMEPACPGFAPTRCALHPLKKRSCCKPNESIAAAADAAVILLYYQCKDHIADTRGPKRLTYKTILPFAASARKKAATRLPALDQLVGESIAAQSALESARCESVDQAAEPTAQILSAMATARAPDEQSKEALSWFGYCLGRWIYMIDAADDLEKDLATGNYNVYALSQNITPGDDDAIEEARRYALHSLNQTLSECAKTLQLLPIKRFPNLLENIITLGLPSVQKQTLHL